MADDEEDRREAPVELRCEALVRVIGRRHVLREVGFQARGGEVVALVGRNGAGKSTLLAMLAGRRAPDRGRLSLTAAGVEARGGALRGLVGFLPHELLVYPDLTARENLHFTAVLHGVPDPAARVAAVLRDVGLEADGDRLVRAFSRGMQQRAAIGRLLVSGARVWLLDEPTTGLDEGGRRWLLSLLADQGRRGRLVIFSTHHPSEVQEAATRVLVLEGGRVVADLPAGAEGAARAFARMEGGGA
ncbi:MAG TPA: heme ABC exporter ATP-binding protein CcmA [Myxococcota bacterium]|nr:heme ABC exporter ATP-binding protein CcmA [Myxococcota bacterium]HQK51379.1 heme ABC exporter ATP-binding protein CcmA [Myxococcota bacterium]